MELFFHNKSKLVYRIWLIWKFLDFCLLGKNNFSEFPWDKELDDGKAGAFSAELYIVGGGGGKKL